MEVSLSRASTEIFITVMVIRHVVATFRCGDNATGHQFAIICEQDKRLTLTVGAIDAPSQSNGRQVQIARKTAELFPCSVNP
jgi:hypothetical protein